MDSIVQRLDNEFLALKNKMCQGNYSYKDVPRRTYTNFSIFSRNRNQNHLPVPQRRLALEDPPTNVVVGYFEDKDYYQKL
jgi:hypothetical protein